MEFTPATRGSGEVTNQPAPAINYKPTRMSPSMAGSTAPIPGSDEPVKIRGAKETAAAPGATEEERGEEGEGSPEEIESRADLSKRLGLIARRDRIVRERSQRVADAEAKLRAREEELAQKESKIRQWETDDVERRRNPRKVLRDYGFTPEAALQYELSGGKLSAEQEAALRLDETLAKERKNTEAQLQAIREEQAKLAEESKRQEEEAAAEEQKQAEQVAVQELKSDIMSIIEEDKDAYRISSKFSDVSDAVYARVRQASDEEYERTGKRPPITTKTLERAAKWVEEQARKRAEEMSSELGFRPTDPIPRSPQTLSNSPVRKRVEYKQEEKPETELERRRRVIAYLDGLKQKNGGHLR